MSRNRKLMIVIGWLAIAVAMTLIGMFSPPAYFPRGSEVAHAQRSHEHMPTAVAALGEVRTRRASADLTAGSPGRVAEVYALEGQQVAEGELLVDLESDAERAAVRVAEAELASARAELQRERRGLRPEDREALEAEANVARVRARNAAESLARLEHVARGGAVAGADLTNQRNEAEASESTALAAAARVRASGSARAEMILIARAHLERAEASLDEARARLALRSVRAPWAGRVANLDVTRGEYVQPGAANVLLRVVDDSVLEVRLEVDEADVGRIASDAPIEVLADSFPNQVLHGRVVRRGHALEYRRLHSEAGTEANDTRVLEVIAEMTDAPQLLPGMRVLARFGSSESEPHTNRSSP